MTLSQLIHRASFVVALCAASVAAQAQWELDNARSSLNFISIKNDAVAETHSFDDLLGYIGEDGVVRVGIDLNSVNTLIDIRDERMREKLFETGKFPTANITARLEPALLQAAAEGGVVSAEVGLTLSLHGVEKTLSAPLVAIGEEGGLLRVFSARPLVINAADFSLDGGVAALREIAGLAAISNAVPVTLHLVFVPAAK